MKPLEEKERKLLSEIRRSRRIGVLMGGPSEEREISLKSGNGVLTHLKEAGYTAIPCDFKTEEELLRKLEQDRIDLAFIALHGRFGEDGTVQTVLEKLKIPYTGSSAQASRLAFDKWASKEKFRAAGLAVPESVLLLHPKPPFKFSFDFPVVVKPVCQGSSIGLSIIDKAESLLEAVREAFRHDDRVLVEPYIQGPELTVGILGEEALPIIRILPANRYYDYESKYVSDRTLFLVPAPLEEGLSASVQKAALKAHEAVGCDGFSRVDLLLNGMNQPVILEVNTIPGLTARSLLPRACEAVKVSYAELCERMILLALFRRVHA